MAEHTREEHIEMMRHPDRWPHTFTLPVVKAGDRMGSQGFLFAPSVKTPCPPPEPVVYLGNLFLGGKVSDREQKRYDSFEALVDDGWVVD